MIYGACTRFGNDNFGATLSALIPLTYLVRHHFVLIINSFKQPDYYTMRLNTLSRKKRDISFKS